MEVLLRVKIELPCDLVGALMCLSPEQSRMEKTQAGNPALQEHLT